MNIGSGVWKASGDNLKITWTSFTIHNYICKCNRSGQIFTSAWSWLWQGSLLNWHCICLSGCAMSHMNMYNDRCTMPGVLRANIKKKSIWSKVWSYGDKCILPDEYVMDLTLCRLITTTVVFNPFIFYQPLKSLLLGLTTLFKHQDL